MAFCGLWHVPSLQMERKRIQNKIAESRWTLSTLTMLALAVWGLAGMGEHRLWINLLCLVLSTYLMVRTCVVSGKRVDLGCRPFLYK